LKQNPPHATDWSIVARMKRIGLEPGKSFEASKVSADVLARGAAAGLKLMQDKAPTIARVTNGWMNTDTMGVYGNFYLKRAIIALVGLGANQVDDAIYPLNVGDRHRRLPPCHEYPARDEHIESLSAYRAIGTGGTAQRERRSQIISYRAPCDVRRPVPGTAARRWMAA
jgi:hypothetical protein